MQPAHGDVEASDRYVSADGRSLCVAPYKHVYTAPCKGRWIGIPLLTAFTCEFASVQAADKEDEHETQERESGSKRPRDVDVSVSLNKFENMMTYIRKLREGSLYVKHREAECISAGAAYQAHLDAVKGLGDVRWQQLLEDASVDINRVLAALPVLVVLSQRDTIFHVNVRHEGWVPFDKPLVVLHASLPDPPVPVASGRQQVGSFPDVPRLLFVDKPYGMPVHPSGKFRKNSVTMILEDVFGGADAFRYEAVPDDAPGAPPNRILIRHKVHKFTIVVLSEQLTESARHCLMAKVCGASSRSASASTSGTAQAPHPVVAPLKVFVVHRLDVATSGVLMFGLDSVSARRTTQRLEEKSRQGNTLCCTDAEGVSAVNWAHVLEGCEKRYVARVKGDLRDCRGSTIAGLVSSVRIPQTFATATRPLGISAQNGQEGGGDDTWMVVSRPIYCASYFNSTYRCPDADDMPAVHSFLKEHLVLHSQQRGGSLLQQELQASGGVLQDKAAKNAAMRNVARSRRPIERQVTSARAAAAPATAGSVGDDDCTSKGGIPLVASGSSSACMAMEAKYPQVKSAVSAFRCLAYDPALDESIVEGIPITGRTHQLRVHLAYLGHPISNDDKYCNDDAAKRMQGDDVMGSGAVGHAQEGEAIYLNATSYRLTFDDVAVSEGEGGATVGVMTELPRWAMLDGRLDGLPKVAEPGLPMDGG